MLLFCFYTEEKYVACLTNNREMLWAKYDLMKIRLEASCYPIPPICHADY